MDRNAEDPERRGTTNVASLFAAAMTGRLSRREALHAGLRLGLATPVVVALMAAAKDPTASAAPVGRPSTARGVAQDGGGTFTVAVISDIDDLDPNYAYDNEASMVLLGAYEMLIQYKGAATDEFEPMLAQTWENNEDGSVYTFGLAPNATFHDGSPCDAEAVKAAFGRIIALAGPPDSAAVAAVLTRFVQSPDQIEVVDPVTIRFNLGRPQPLFLAAMASSYGVFITNPRVIEENRTEDDPQAHLALQETIPEGAGTGPYRFVEYAVGERLVLTKYDGYHGGWTGDEFTDIVIRIVPENSTRRLLIERGEADALTFNLTPGDLEPLRANPAVQVLEYDTTRTDWIIMNVPRLLSVEARRGFSHAFPYQAVIETAYRGLLKRSGPVADTIRGADPAVFFYQTDTAKAKELLLAGGVAEGETFEYVFPAGDEVQRTVAQLFQANLAEIGFGLEVTEIEGAALSDLVYGDLPAEEQPHFIGGWSWWPDYNDPWNQLYPNFTIAAQDGGGSNAGDWENTRFEELMTEAATYTDEARLTEIMAEAQNILTEQDPACIYLGQVRYYTVLGTDIQGFQHNPLYLDAFPFYKMRRAAG